MALIGQRCCGNCAHYKLFPPPVGDGKNRVCAEGPMVVEQVPHIFRLFGPGVHPQCPEGGAEMISTKNMIVPRLTRPEYVCGRWKTTLLDSNGGIAN